MDVNEELTEIARKHHGLLRPADVVEFARDKKTALYSRFEWDDTKAADEYRLWQAREIIHVAVTVLPGLKKPIQAFVSLNRDRQREGGGYRFLVDVMSNPAHRTLLLQEAFAEFKHWELKYKRLRELAPIFMAGAKVAKKKKLA
jgi:hypothetical protein